MCYAYFDIVHCSALLKWHYLIFYYRSVVTGFTPPREQTEGTRNLSSLGREATPPRSLTPDQTSQVRTNCMVLKIHSIKVLLEEGGVRLSIVNHHSLSLSMFVLEKGWHHILGLNQPQYSTSKPDGWFITCISHNTRLGCNIPKYYTGIMGHNYYKLVQPWKYSCVIGSVSDSSKWDMNDNPT